MAARGNVQSAGHRAAASRAKKHHPRPARRCHDAKREYVELDLSDRLVTGFDIQNIVTFCGKRSTYTHVSVTAEPAGMFICAAPLPSAIWIRRSLSEQVTSARLPSGFRGCAGNVIDYRGCNSLCASAHKSTNMLERVKLLILGDNIRASVVHQDSTAVIATASLWPTMLIENQVPF